MKFSKLAALKKSAGTGHSRRGDADEISRQSNLDYLRTATYVLTDYARALALTDSEIEAYLLGNNGELIARGTVSKEDRSDLRTVQRLGWQLIKNGWSIVPQDRHGQRKPSDIPVPVRAGKYGKEVSERRYAFRPSLWRERRMNIREFLELENLFNANLAFQCCAASGHVRVLDIDCRDAAVSQEVMRIALEELGATPFIRYGARPKVMLVYRVSKEDSKDQKWSVALRGADGQEEVDEEGQPINQIEWLATGSLITAFGYHHKTGENFDWSEGRLSPLTGRPEDAPLVDKTMLRRFINRVQAFRQVVGAMSTSNPYGNKSTFTEFDNNTTYRGNIRTPRRSSGPWTVDASGKVTDGAEAWLTAHAWAYCAVNHEHLPGGLQDMIDLLAFEAKSKLMGRHRNNSMFLSEASTERAVAEKMRSAAAKWIASLDSKMRTGRYLDGAIPWTVGEDGRRAISQRIAPSERPVDGSLDWIPDESCPVEALAETIPSAKTAIVDKTAERRETDRQMRALWTEQTDRHAIGKRVETDVRGAIGDWLMTVPEWDGNTPVAPWILRAPTGAGKTVGVIGKLADFCAAHPRAKGDGPILLVLPTHANGDEAMATALREGMIAPDVWTEKDVEGLKAALKKLGVKIARFKGRIAAECKRPTELKALQEKGIGASGLCGADVEVVGEDEDQRIATELDRKLARKAGEKLDTQEILCAFRARGECGYYNQMADLERADIVIISHAYLSLSSLPKPLRKPRAVIIDESVTYSLIDQSRMPISTLNLPRREPYVIKTDRTMRKGWTDEEIKAWFVGAREELAALTVHWLAEDKDIPTELIRRDAFIAEVVQVAYDRSQVLAVLNGEQAADFPDVAKTIRGLMTGRRDLVGELKKLDRSSDLLRAAIVVCDRANDRHRRVRPDMSPGDVEALAIEETGRQLLDEIRFWKLVRERIENVGAGTARGERDTRWQVVENIEEIVTEKGKTFAVTPHLRLSWRKAPNWAGRPMLLLDASARPRIVEKLFGAQPVVRSVEAPLHVRTIAMIEKTWSNSSFVAKADSSDEELKIIAENIESARRLITTTAVIHGHGRVLVGTTIAVREVLTGGAWVPPPNTDFVHFGALRGLDFAKHHLAAISIGRSEQPISVIDGYAAALTYDDDVPELPYDLLGTGVTAEGKPLFRKSGWKRIAMRTGQDVDHMVPGMQPKPVLDDKGKPTRDADGKPVTTPTWALELEESWREEELRQFLGRLRPVFRGTTDDLPPPIWIAAGKILPDGIVVDELLEMKALLKAWPMAELVRLGGGVLADNVTPHLPGAQDLLQGRTLAEMAKNLPRAMPFLRRWAAPFEHIRYHLATDPAGKDRSAMLLPGWIQGSASDYWMALSERYGELPELISVSEPKLVAGDAKAKPLDKRDINRDDAMLAEIEAREAHRAEAGAADHGRVEFELRRARGLYHAREVEDAPA